MKKILMIMVMLTIIICALFANICLATGDPHPPILPPMPLDQPGDTTDVDSNFTLNPH